MTSIPLTDIRERFGFADLASSKVNKTMRGVRSRSAIVIIGVDLLSRIFVLHAWADRVSTTKLRDQIIEVTAKFRPKYFGIESNAMQTLFADLVIDEAKRRELHLNLYPFKQPTSIDKDFRIRSILQDPVESGRVFTMPTQYELNQEIASFPMSPQKDLIDALASAISLVPKRRTQRAMNDEIAQLATYLRNSGAPASYIEKRIEELKLQEALA